MASRMFNRGFFAVLGLTALLCLAGIVVLPGLGSWVDLAQAQTEPAGVEAPAVNHNTWTSGAAMPTAVEFPAGTGVLTGQIYLVGGYQSGAVAVADNQIYNPVTNTWSTGAALPSATAQGASAVVKNVLYVFGGSNNVGSTVTNAVWAYNPKNAWSSKAAMPTARCSAAAVVEKNIIYVIGGYSPSGGGTRLNTVESYTPATNTWTEEAPLLVGKSEPAVGLVGTTIVATGGYSSSGETGDNEGYSASMNSWKSFTSDPTVRNGACAGSIGPQMYVAGGTGPLTLTESFKVSKNKWTTLAPMPQAAAVPGSAVYKGLLYCIGGSSSGVIGQGILGNVQIYQP
jgi:N-acetylneuraminic acid mutarotase